MIQAYSRKTGNPLLSALFWTCLWVSETRKAVLKAYLRLFLPLYQSEWDIQQ
jgi:hypothetical protein